MDPARDHRAEEPQVEVFASWTDWASAEQALAARLPAPTVAALARAYGFAEEHHGDQTRPAGEPYVHHLLEALEIAVDSGATDPDVLVAVLLHDVVEDTPCSLDEVRAEFGERVAELVDWVTKPEGADAGLRQRYLARFASAPAEVLTIKLSDRYSNVQRLHTHPRPAKRASYYAETVRYVLPLAERYPYFRERFARWAAHFAPQLGG
jgi:guanosine-3',5'-bis(diphosphate) 3'-pyrophosphohydrolase